jgi:hypothetical protein
MGWFGDFLKMFYVYKVGESAGRKPWEDKTLLTALVSFLATIVAKYWELDLSADEQAGIVVMFTIIARLLSPHVGIRPQTTLEVVEGVPSVTVSDPQVGSDASIEAKAQQADELIKNTMGRQDAGQ